MGKKHGKNKTDQPLEKIDFYIYYDIDHTDHNSLPADAV